LKYSNLWKNIPSVKAALYVAAILGSSDSSAGRQAEK